ncbi:MAG: trypsin-like peptidase domain-containing protein, partial [Luteimonas sp.]|nr:trypsin-like peptidase domain-containing protein [Luteimonas sp.]
MRPSLVSLIVATVAVLAASGVQASLPQSVEGQPLPSLAPMIDRVTPAVVNINTKTRVQVRDPFFDFFNMPNVPRERVQQSLGSGVIVDAAKGYVLTNNHVVQGADDIDVTLHDERTLKAKVIGSDPDTDLTVLQIPAERLEAVPMAASRNLRVGDFVVAIGNPFGLGQTVTSGIVSALERTGVGRGYQSFIQTDASINPGNSGGALVNLRGELVGINSMIFSPSGGNVGIGFAIPTDLAAEVMRQLVAYGEVKRGVLGIDTQDITAELARMLALDRVRGAVVTRVRAGSPAAEADLRPGDVVTGV